jgi:hypothetical protein
MVLKNCANAASRLPRDHSWWCVLNQGQKECFHATPLLDSVRMLCEWEPPRSMTDNVSRSSPIAGQQEQNRCAGDGVEEACPQHQLRPNDTLLCAVVQAHEVQSKQNKNTTKEDAHKGNMKCNPSRTRTRQRRTPTLATRHVCPALSSPLKWGRGVRHAGCNDLTLNDVGERDLISCIPTATALASLPSRTPHPSRAAPGPKSVSIADTAPRHAATRPRCCTAVCCAYPTPQSITTHV